MPNNHSAVTLLQPRLRLPTNRSAAIEGTSQTYRRPKANLEGGFAHFHKARRSRLGSKRTKKSWLARDLGLATRLPAIQILGCNRHQ